MSIHTRKCNDILLIGLVGPVGHSAADNLSDLLRKVIAQDQVRKILVNMSQVNYIFSKGLGVLASIIKLVRESGGILKLYGLQIKVRELFLITMLDSVVEIFEEEDIAIKSFQINQDI